MLNRRRMRVQLDGVLFQPFLILFVLRREQHYVRPTVSIPVGEYRAIQLTRKVQWL